MLALLLPLFAFAQEADPPTDESADIDTEMDEIIVVGARTLASMRTEVVMAEDEVYDLFNELNDDDDYDIICKMETRIGSQIPRRVCLARMYRDALEDATVDDDISGLTVGNMTRSSKHQKILREKMRLLAIEHPELLTSLKKRYALEKKFEEARENKYGEQ